MTEMIFLIIYGLGAGAALVHIVTKYEPNLLLFIALIIMVYPIGLIMAYFTKSIFNYFTKKNEV